MRPISRRSWPTAPRCIRARPDKDESDTELCLLTALDRGATHIRLLGALGGTRIDHELANVSLLAHPRLDGIDVRIEDGPATIVRIGTPDGPGSIVLAGAPGGTWSPCCRSTAGSTA